MSEPVVYTLKHPIEIKAKDSETVIDTITEVKLHRPKGKHLRRLDKIKGDAAQTFLLLGDLTGLSTTALDEIDGEDFVVLGEMIEGFFGKSSRPETGATSTGT